MAPPKAQPDEADRDILERVCGATDAWSGTWGIGNALPVRSPFVLTPALQRDLVERMCATGRLMLRPAGDHDAQAPLVRTRWTPEMATFRLVIDGSSDAGYDVAGIVEELFPSEALTDVHAFFDAPDDAELARRMGLMAESTARFGADRTLDLVPTSRYVLSTPSNRSR